MCVNLRQLQLSNSHVGCQQVVLLSTLLPHTEMHWNQQKPYLMAETQLTRQETAQVRYFYTHLFKQYKNNEGRNGYLYSCTQPPDGVHVHAHLIIHFSAVFDLYLLFLSTLPTVQHHVVKKIVRRKESSRNNINALHAHIIIAIRKVYEHNALTSRMTGYLLCYHENEWFFILSILLLKMSW